MWYRFFKIKVRRSWLKQNKKYTKKEFITVLAIALSFTLLYFMASYTLWLDVPDAMQVTSECIGILMPVILLMSWYMCIERYVAIEYNLAENEGNKSYLFQVAVRIILLIIGGINVYRSILNVVIYPFNSLKDYLDNYNACYAVKISIAVVWVALILL